jgi:hypothetical protein
MKRVRAVPAFAVIFTAVFLIIISTNQSANAQLPIKITSSYAAKFVCGAQPIGLISASPWPDVQAGRYSTKLAVHHNAGGSITFRKKIIMLRGGEAPTDPQWTKLEGLGEDQALEVVCQDIYGYLGMKTPPPGDPWPYINGFVIFEVYYDPNKQKSPPPPDPLDVEGVYTYKGDLPGSTNANASGVSINVVVFPAKNNSHLLH